MCVCWMYMLCVHVCTCCVHVCVLVYMLCVHVCMCCVHVCSENLQMR